MAADSRVCRRVDQKQSREGARPTTQAAFTEKTTSEHISKKYLRDADPPANVASGLLEPTCAGVVPIEDSLLMDSISISGVVRSRVNATARGFVHKNIGVSYFSGSLASL